MIFESIWNNVTLIQTSDFARTLNPNGGDGTDHAWGKFARFQYCVGMNSWEPVLIIFTFIIKKHRWQLHDDG